MFISDFVTVDLGLAEVRRRLLDEAGSRLSDHALAAEDECDRLWMRVGPTLGGHQAVSRAVVLDMGPPRERGDRVVFALRWESQGGAAWLFPTLDSDLELAPLGAETTQITLNGRYEPPLYGLGRGLDHLLLHRVAQSTIRAFLRRLADALSVESPSLPVARTRTAG